MDKLELVSVKMPYQSYGKIPLCEIEWQIYKQIFAESNILKLFA